MEDCVCERGKFLCPTAIRLWNVATEAYELAAEDGYSEEKWTQYHEALAQYDDYLTD